MLDIRFLPPSSGTDDRACFRPYGQKLGRAEESRQQNKPLIAVIKAEAPQLLDELRHYCTS
jgi:hypothetical protein